VVVLEEALRNLLLRVVEDLVVEVHGRTQEQLEEQNEVVASCRLEVALVGADQHYIVEAPEGQVVGCIVALAADPEEVRRNFQEEAVRRNFQEEEGRAVLVEAVHDHLVVGVPHIHGLLVVLEELMVLFLVVHLDLHAYPVLAALVHLLQLGDC